MSKKISTKPYRAPHRPRKPRNSLLAKWLDADGAPTVADIAAELDVTPAVLYNWRSGNFKPGRENAAKLEKISGGVVTVASWDSVKRKARA